MLLNLNLIVKPHQRLGAMSPDPCVLELYCQWKPPFKIPRSTTDLPSLSLTDCHLLEYCPAGSHYYMYYVIVTISDVEVIVIILSLSNFAQMLSASPTLFVLVLCSNLYNIALEVEHT